MPPPAWLPSRIIRWISVGVVLSAACILLLGGQVLIAADPTPGRLDAAIVLQGSIVAEKTRLAGALSLLQEGIADRVLLNVPKESYWGQSIPPVARAYVERTYGSDLAARLDFCEMGPEVNSTKQEAEAALSCIRQHRWLSVAIVTSNYHTRRARIIWRRAAKKYDPAIQVSIQSVADPEFQQPWWRSRQSAKIWLLEFSKLVWALFGG
jgi:uncharacterized SAM-binding protein YcdF (DUF218 family)